MFTLLALLGTYILIGQTAQRIPRGSLGRRDAGDPRSDGEPARATSRSSHGSSAPAAPTTAEQLTQLADLRDRGAISPDEYQSAKERLLNV